MIRNALAVNTILTAYIKAASLLRSREPLGEEGKVGESGKKFYEKDPRACSVV